MIPHKLFLCGAESYIQTEQTTKLGKNWNKYKIRMCKKPAPNN